jgi:hypothetical protein
MTPDATTRRLNSRQDRYCNTVTGYKPAGVSLLKQNIVSHHSTDLR